MAKKKTNLCKKCQGLCCRYVALPLDEPTDKGDFDDIRWYLAHENITVFVEDGDWYVNFKTTCRHLSEDDYMCTMYETRPKICRKYKASDCDFAEGEYDYDLHFTDDKQMQEYIKIKFDNNVIEKPKRAKGAKARKKTKTAKKVRQSK